MCRIDRSFQRRSGDYYARRARRLFSGRPESSICSGCSNKAGLSREKARCHRAARLRIRAEGSCRTGWAGRGLPKASREGVKGIFRAIQESRTINAKLVGGVRDLAAKQKERLQFEMLLDAGGALNPSSKLAGRLIRQAASEAGSQGLTLRSADTSDETPRNQGDALNSETCVNQTRLLPVETPDASILWTNGQLKGRFQP
jgi:hypothetical protein